MTEPAKQIDDLEVKFDNTHILALPISEQMLHDNLVSAIEGGCQYWANIDVGVHEPGWANYFTAWFTVDVESVEVHGAIRGKSYKLSIDKLMRGLGVLAQKYPHHFCDIIGENGDADTGDVLVQCALFGDIVYG